MSSHQNHAQVILALDVGGTFIKSAVFAAGELQRELPQIPSCSLDRMELILAAFSRAVRQAGDGIEAVAVAIPGPFDYRAGISHMTHKFAALNGQCLREAFCGLPVRFVHDANAFLLGESRSGAVRGMRRAAGLTLGTGVGAAFLDNGVLRCNALGSPAAEVSLWNTPFRGGIVEDAISARALVQQSGARNALELAHAANAGEAAARLLWRKFGETLAEIIEPWMARLAAEAVVFGGQLSNDFELFAEPLSSLPVRRSQLGTQAALIGAATLWEES
ncbi:MAG: ROK family protein [Victivallaceae bacterium]|nr:ROK family protein [Victivallaceae bacterium]